MAQPYYWRIVGRNGYDVLARSETLVRKEHALEMARLLKTSARQLRFEVFRSNAGYQPWSWRVWADNNKILISASETYTSHSAANAAAESVKGNAWSAEIVDKTRSAASSSARW
ncbi:DUF1508 domain-containing protein [Catellatospora sp. TT07R-123]|uniref:YegP family protein n=1 Tax=Catellatospora sp. TT07R-123 TaxID=2733863 RepID=UPI001BB3C83E|nr:DUF1508 domain-containing protein [Catellatospora sp. TT07R-123]